MLTTRNYLVRLPDLADVRITTYTLQTIAIEETRGFER